MLEMPDDATELKFWRKDNDKRSKESNDHSYGHCVIVQSEALIMGDVRPLSQEGKKNQGHK